MKCNCIDRRHAEYDRFSRDKRSAAFYHSQEWIRLSERVRIDYGCDVYEYMTTGRIVRPDAVHHIIPLKDDWSRRLDRSNLIPLSAGNHDMIEHEYKKNKIETQKKLFEMLENFNREKF